MYNSFVKHVDKKKKKLNTLQHIHKLKSTIQSDVSQRLETASVKPLVE